MEPIVDIHVPARGWPRDEAGRHFCPKVEGTTWSESAHGCAVATFTVLDPATTAHLTVDCPVVISSPTSGAVLWTGNVANDGVQVSPLGDRAVVRAVGNVDWAYRSYWSLPYKVIEDYSWWDRETIKYRSATNWDTATGARPADPPWDAVLISIAQGKNCYPGEGGRQQYTGHLGSDMYIGGISFNADHGTAMNPDDTTPTQLRTDLFVGDQFWGESPWAKIWDTTAVEVNARASSSGWSAPPAPAASPPRDDKENYLILRTRNERTAGVETVNENVWFAASLMCIIGQRVNRHGQNVYPSADRVGLTQIDAAMIVEDLVGRCLVGVVDPTRLTIDHTSDWNLDGTVNYFDPTSPGEILTDLEAFHPDHLWRIGKVSQTTGLAPMAWRPWETAPRYVVDTDRAEVDLDGGPQALYNRVAIRWTDWKGRTAQKTFDASPAQYPDIASLQGVRQPEPLDLDESLGRLANVDRIGEMWLDQVARRHPTGTITVTRPILDTSTQLLVPPAEIEAASTVALSRDEPTRVYRVLEVEHRGMGEAVLSVGAKSLSLDQIVATRGHGRK